MKKFLFGLAIGIILMGLWGEWKEARPDEVEIITAPEIIFDDFPESKVWFDRELNKWRYKGSLDDIEKQFIENLGTMPVGVDLILYEILRQLKLEEKENEKNFIHYDSSRDILRAAQSSK